MAIMVNVLCLCLLIFAPLAQAGPDYTAGGRISLHFIPNQGVHPEEVLFYARTQCSTVFFTASGVVFTTICPVDEKNRAQSYRLDFVNAKASLVEGQSPEEHRVSYLIGNDPEKWKTGIQTFGGIRYRDLYPGTDLAYSSQGGLLKYEYILRPGADIRRIRLAFQRIESISLEESGDLLVQTESGLVRDARPIAYQTIEGKKVDVQARFALLGGHTFGFEVDRYDPAHPLVIDPLRYSTFLGGSGQDYAEGIAVDGSGCAYVAGNTRSVRFPVTPEEYNSEHREDQDLFVSKLKADGSALLYSTLIGGSGKDHLRRLAIDGSGNAYLTGYTESTDFPTTAKAYDRTHNGNLDAFVSKLDAAGTVLTYSTFLGGNSSESGYDIVVDASANAYITGYTKSGNFPTTAGAYDTSQNGGTDTFVTKLNANGSALVYSTFLGDSYDDEGYALAVDGSSNAYVTGMTDRTSDEVFVRKLNATGTGRLYSLLLGGSGDDLGGGIAVDANGNVYVAGTTQSSNFQVTSGAYDTSYNGARDIFVSKINSAGTILLYSTFLGGSGDDYLNDLKIDSGGRVYLTGTTSSDNFPTTPDAHDSSFNGGTYDLFLTELNATYNGLLYSSYFGGSGSDVGYRLFVSGSFQAYLAGYTESADFPATTGAYDTSYNGGGDAFVARFDLHTVTVPKTPEGWSTATQGKSSTYTTGESSCKQGHTVQYRFDWGDGTYSTWSTATSAGHVYSSAGTYFLRAQARCSQTTSVVTDWSENKTVTVYATHTLVPPNVPSGPGSATIKESISYSSEGCSCNQGHAVQYRFSWGDGTYSTWSESTSASRSYTKAGTYSIKAQGRCSQDTAVTTGLSNARSLTVYATHTVTPPQVPVGPETATILESDTYTTGSASCNQGHTIEYQFDWGNGTYSDWSTSTAAGYAYSTAGTYSIKARARCSHDNAVLSAWSTGKNVTVYAEHIVGVPDTPSGPNNGFVAQNLEYATGHSTCNQGHSIEYRFDWGDGNFSSWSTDTLANRVYGSPGSYGIKAQARCSHKIAVGATSGEKPVTIAPHTINVPDTPAGPGNGFVAQSLSYVTGGSSCNQGHTIEYRIDWGDGLSPWSTGTTFVHVYDQAGEYFVKSVARCQEYPTISSDWSSGKAVTVAPHTVGLPNVPTGPDGGDAGDTLTYTTGGATCNQGHVVEYQFDWGDGTTSDWSSSPSAGHAYVHPGSYSIVATARCREYPVILSGKSGAKSTVLLSHIVNRPDKPGALGYAETGESISFTAGGSACDQGHPVQYRFEWGDGENSLWSEELSASHLYSTRGHYPVKVMARCSIKTSLVSEWSLPHHVHVAVFIMDFDGDGKSDLSIWKKETGDWHCLNSGDDNASELRKRWGISGEKEYVPVPADYDGDKKTDLAVWKKETGEWYCLRSSENNGSYLYGRLGETGWKEWVPVPGDYDGDRKADLCVWNKNTSEWLYLRSSDGILVSTVWGDEEGVKKWIPVPGDYDGDRTTDLCVWNKNTGAWYGRKSSDLGNPFSIVWKSGGVSQWIPVPGDYDGDLASDLGIWNKSTGEFHCAKVSDGSTIVVKQWRRGGAMEWIPVPGDYDGDGKIDLSVWHKSRGQWYAIKSSDEGGSYFYKIFGDQGINRWIPSMQLQHVYLCMSALKQD